jgi:transcriptional regulator with XRE-family HTH domain
MSGQPEPAKPIENRNAEIGRRIRARRLECGFSQTQLGVKLGVKFQQIQKYEKGVNAVSSDRLEQICDLFQVPITFFYGSNGTTRTGQAAVAENTLFDLLQRRDTQRVAKAFDQLPSRDLRRALLVLIEKIAGVQTVSRKKRTRKKNRASANKPKANAGRRLLHTSTEG